MTGLRYLEEDNAYKEALTILLMLLIKRDSPGPAIFAQPRVGRNNHRYQCYKPRITNDPHGNRRPRDDEGHKDREFLRRASLDELPQLGNVIWGYSRRTTLACTGFHCRRRLVLGGSAGLLDAPRDGRASRIARAGCVAITRRH
jgi:hypothetical protein